MSSAPIARLTDADTARLGSADGYILLVEDNPGDARLTQALLDEPGGVGMPALRWVQSIAAATETLARWPHCGAVLLDLGLPGSQGLEALHALQPVLAACPVIVLTSDESDSVGMASVAAGAQDFLVKGSFDGALLRRCIRFAGQRKRAELALISQTLAAQQASVANASRLQEALRRVADGFVAFDAKQRFTYVNARAGQLLGTDTPAELLGGHLWTLFPQLVGTPFQQVFEQAMRSQQAAVMEAPLASVGRWFNGRLYPSADGLSIYFSDVTERRLAQRALRLSEQRYRLAAAQGQVWDWDLVAGRASIPVAFWQLLGSQAPPDDGHTALFAALLHPDDLAPWRAALRAHLSRRQPYLLEYRARHADGHWRWFQTQGQAVWDAQGRATYMAGTAFEITERKQAEIALRESETYRRQLFEQLADGVLLIDWQLRLHDANPQALAMLGYRREALLQLSATDLLADFERHRVAPLVAALMSGRPQLADWEFLRQDGSRFPAEVNARALDGQRFLAVLRDTSLRRAAEQALLDFQFELSQLAQRLLTQEKATTQKVAQALHDHLGQTLAVARLKLDACIGVHRAGMPAALQAQAEQISLLLDQAVREVRQVLADLRPPLLEEQGLAAALDNEIRTRGVLVSGADVLLIDDLQARGQRWPAAVEYAAFMVAREAITNALRHAGAGLIRVLLGGGQYALRLEVIDDGCGIAQPLVRGRPGHLGMVGMRERAIAIGARFAALPEPAGGTRVSLHWEAPAP